ncbi:MAG: hypothetical protein WA001_05875 [Patescibacteria group bacterium]
MYEKIAEPVEVLVAFRKGRIEPMTFKWGTRYFQVKKVNLVHTERRGRERIHIFSVSDGDNAYRLEMSSETMTWTLEEMATL